MPDARRDPSLDADLARARGLSGLFQALAREKLEIAPVADLRMQLMMDRRAKLVSTLSNILRTVSTSQDALVRNIK